MAGNNNTTLASAVVQQKGSDIEPCADEDFFFIVYGPLYGLVCGFGLVGNLLSFAVLHKYSRNNVATYLLKALAVMDNLFLAIAALVQMYTAMVFHFNLIEQFEPIFPYFQTFAWPLTHMVQVGTVWMMVLVAGNRFIAVCRPLHAPHLCRKKNVQIQLVVLTVCIIVYNIPRFFEYRYINVTVTGANNTTEVVEQNLGLTSYHLYNILYENVAYCTFVFFLPLLILIIFNVHLMRELKKAQQCRRALKGRSSKEENNITLVMIIIIIVFIVCQTPASINQILFYMVSESDNLVCGSYRRFFHISNLLLTVNSAMNFVIYCLFRRQFQQELLALFCRRRPGNGDTSLRKTIILRALHERTMSTYASERYRSEQEPLREDSCHSNLAAGQDNHLNGYPEGYPHTCQGTCPDTCPDNHNYKAHADVSF